MNPKSRRARTWLAIAIAVVVVGVGTAIYFKRRPAEAPAFDTVSASRGKLIARVTATGTLSALVTVQVGSQVSGRLATILVDFNSEVKKGQLIATIDPPLFQAALEQARANHASAQANFQRAKVQRADLVRQFDRARALRQQSLIAQADLDTAEANARAADAQVAASRAAVEQTQAALRQAEINLAYTKIVSPINGVVISRNVDVGQTVAASLQAPTLFTIAEDLRRMQVHTNIAEADVGKLSPQMEATFRVDAYTNQTFKGTVSQIRNAPQTLQNVVTYDAVIEVENPELKLKPGMTANVTLVYADRENVLRVPNAALRFRPTPEMLKAAGEGGRSGGAGGPRAGGGGGNRQGRGGGGGAGAPGAKAGAGDSPDAARADEKTLWVLRDNRPTPIRVKIGISDGTMSEVVSGDLNEGDAIITDARKSGAGGNMSPGMRRLF